MAGITRYNPFKDKMEAVAIVDDNDALREASTMSQDNPDYLYYVEAYITSQRTGKQVRDDLIYQDKHYIGKASYTGQKMQQALRYQRVTYIEMLDILIKDLAPGSEEDFMPSEEVLNEVDSSNYSAPFRNRAHEIADYYNFARAKGGDEMEKDIARLLVYVKKLRREAGKK